MLGSANRSRQAVAKLSDRCAASSSNGEGQLPALTIGSWGRDPASEEPLIHHGAWVVTTTTLLSQVWGRRNSGNADRVHTVVNKLRRELGDDAARPAYIFNERAGGYRMARPDGA